MVQGQQMVGVTCWLVMGEMYGVLDLWLSGQLKKIL